MKALVLYFDDNRSSVDLEFEGRVFDTVPFGTTVKAPGFKVKVLEDGNTEEDLDMNVQVGAYHDTFCEYLFDELEVSDVETKENDD